MLIQKSYETANAKLYLVSTPIGNLGDITFRALEILRMVDYIACEDTRVTIKLLNYYDIKKPLISYHEHNKYESGINIIDKIKLGNNVALVSDAGTPCISDPGFEIVKLAIENNIDVVPIPGPSALISALICSGLVPQPFTFFGFLDHHKQAKRKQLEELTYHPYTMIFYESPHRFKETISLMSEVFGERSCAIVREISKRYEEVYRGLLNDVLTYYEEIKGEIVIIVEGTTHPQYPQDPLIEEMDIIEHVNHYVELGLSKSEAIKRVASERKLSKREVYNYYHSQN